MIKCNKEYKKSQDIASTIVLKILLQYWMRSFSLNSMGYFNL